MKKNQVKKIIKIIAKISIIPLLPLMALAWWTYSDDSYWESLKGIWRTA